MARSSPAIRRLTRKLDIGTADSAANEWAKLLGVNAGRLEVGAEADIAVVDPDRPWIVNTEKMAAAAGNTPFDRQPVQGRGEVKASSRTFAVRGAG